MNHITFKKIRFDGFDPDDIVSKEKTQRTLIFPSFKYSDYCICRIERSRQVYVQHL